MTSFHLVVLTLVVCSCSALPQFLDNVRKMSVEHEPLLKLREAAGTISHSDRPTDLLKDFAVEIFNEKIRAAETAGPGPIPEVAARLGLTYLVNLVAKAGLLGILKEEGPFTVFGPTNQALDDLPEFMKIRLGNVTFLAEVLKYHVLSGKKETKQLTNELQVATLEGSEVRFNVYNVEETEVRTAQCQPLDLKEVDQEASNGVIHVLRGVMFPPAGDAVFLLSENMFFTALVQAISQAGLEETLSGPGPFTIFAPTNAAFRKLTHGQIEKLLKNLKNVLKYHVVPGTHCSIGLTSGNVKTLEGQTVRVTVSRDGVLVNRSKVIAADASVTNGVIHAIDTVLFPPGF